MIYTLVSYLCRTRRRIATKGETVFSTKSVVTRPRRCWLILELILFVLSHYAHRKAFLSLYHYTFENRNQSDENETVSHQTRSNSIFGNVQFRGILALIVTRIQSKAECLFATQLSDKPCSHEFIYFNSFVINFIAEQILWTNSWSEEWVVLYDDSTMAWFTVSFIWKSCKVSCEHDRSAGKLSDFHYFNFRAQAFSRPPKQSAISIVLP